MQTKRKRKFIVVFWDGPLNGAERYFCTLSAAKKCGIRYIDRCVDYPDRVGFDIYELDDSFHRHHICFL